MKKLYFSVLCLCFQALIFYGYCLNPEKIYKYTTDDFGLNIADSLKIKTSDGYNIFIYLFNPKSNIINKTIILSYGDAGNLSYYFSYAKRLTDYGYSVVLFDYRGFGKSDDFEIDKNHLFYTEFAIDLSTVICYTKSKYPQNSIGIMAFSMGTIFATLVSDTNSIDFIISENYVTNIYSVKERLERITQNYSSFLLPPNITEKEYLSKINEIRVPILVFSSILDKVTTLEDSYIFSNNDKCKIVPYEGNHGCGLVTLSENYFQEINQFLKNTN